MNSQFIKKYAPSILTGIASVGVIGTTILAIKATPKVYDILEESKKEDAETNKFYVTTAVLKEYIPTILVGTGTILCIIGANVINKRQQASLMSAYMLLDKSYDQYKNKLIELYGKETHDNILDSIAVEESEYTDIFNPTLTDMSHSLSVQDLNNKEYLFYDEYSKRYFRSTFEQVLIAEYNLNRNFVLRGFATLHEYFDFLGLDGRKGDEDIGWAICDEGIYWIDFNHRPAYLEDGSRYISISMPFGPGVAWQEYMI